ncbi:MAG: type I restriction enzyme HsdR N-terminal domain-containing protein [Pseudomonas sp.]|uniref:type I restriction enzyme HsdR N-terminal domain-containing protein n=1 Tax=Pseudomonas sp. TaxID=306 RepID=UPI003D0A8948
MADDVIGITVCDDCGTRYKLREKNRHQIGKPARCQKCNAIFTVELVDPTPLENAAIKNEEEQAQEVADKRPRQRRSKEQIRQEYLDTIRSGFKALHPRLVAMELAEKTSEENVRIWVVDALVNALGYRHEEIDTEVRTLGKRVDIALKKDGQIFLVIECKAVRSKLNTSVRDQAINYATSLSASWAVITNGHTWRLYQIIPRTGRDPRLVEIFDIALLDADGVGESDVEGLYLVTARALFGGETERMSHQIACTSKRQILQTVTSERVIKAMRLELIESYRNQNGVSVSLDDETVKEVVSDVFGVEDL